MTDEPCAKPRFAPCPADGSYFLVQTDHPPLRTGGLPEGRPPSPLGARQTPAEKVDIHEHRQVSGAAGSGSGAVFLSFQSSVFNS